MEANGEVKDLVAKVYGLAVYVQKAAGCGSCTQPRGAIERITIPIIVRCIDGADCERQGV